MKFSPVVFTGIVAIPLASGQCTRESLKQATDSYIAAQTNGDISSMTPLAAEVVYIENDKTVDIASGILSKAQKIDNQRSTFDTTDCASYTELIIADSTQPHVIGTQIRLEGDKIAHIESVVTSEGDWLFNAANTLRYAQQETWDPIPEDKRDTRQVIQAAGDAYLDLFNDKSVQVPWGTPCRRLEGGAYTGTGSPDDTCNVGVPSGVALVNRRYVVDEVLGTVDIFLNFGGEGGLPDSHEFRVEGGKLRYVHTLTVMS